MRQGLRFIKPWASNTCSTTSGHITRSSQLQLHSQSMPKKVACGQVFLAEPSKQRLRTGETASAVGPYTKYPHSTSSIHIYASCAELSVPERGFNVSTPCRSKPQVCRLRSRQKELGNNLLSTIIIHSKLTKAQWAACTKSNQS